MIKINKYNMFKSLNFSIFLEDKYKFKYNLNTIKHNFKCNQN